MEMLKQKKKTTGRKRIEIKKLEKEANKQVTFSKRRVGMFKKASELCILCNAHVAIIVFSPADKLFCFGEPSTEAVVERYLKGAPDFEPIKSSERKKLMSCEEHNRKYEEAMKALELEKKNKADVEGFAKVWGRGEWWNEEIHEMSVEQLEQFLVAIYELRSRLLQRAAEIMMMHGML
ncbi:agamous-like MADS-box protein AGL61 [Arachis stenosperma]|uniref:agamous-like MADS-box protein AGL61 n=1 Tax=Arachis stenosperma TaxID=217475 RepID=UPI0025ACEE6E|nr:agamous-like MADS-box protein AGL61 [Arachis stenosperma]